MASVDSVNIFSAYYESKTHVCHGRSSTARSTARETRGPSSPVSAPLTGYGLERLAEAELSRRTGRLLRVTAARRANARHRRDGSRDYEFADPRTGEAPAVSRGRNVRSRCRCSMCPAIHINSRS